MAKKLSENEVIKEINKIYVSNLNRAIETVKISKPNCEYTITSQLRERDLGIFEGDSIKNLKLVSHNIEDLFV